MSEPSLLYLVATLTPFDSRGRVDLARLRAHVLWLSAKGVDGFVPTGTTGEFLYLSEREREAVHRTVIDAARSKHIYPCTWDPNPATAAYLSDAAREQGATGVLMPPPLFYRLNDGEVLGWFRQIHEAVRLPILAYHNPAYIPSHVSPAVYQQLRAEGVVAGMKDSSGDPYRVRRLSELHPGTIFAGGDRILGEAARMKKLAGFISAIGNVWPSFCLRVFRGESQLQDALSDRVSELMHAGGVRAMKGILGMGCRSPLLAPSRERLLSLPAAERP